MNFSQSNSIQDEQLIPGTTKNLFRVSKHIKILKWMLSCFRTSIFIFILLPIGALSQKDSLWNIWNNTQHPDTMRHQAMSKLLGGFYCRQDPDSAIILGNIQIESALKTKNNKALAEAWSNIGTAHDAKGEHRESFDCQAKAVEYRKLINDPINLARTYSSMGTAARYMGQFAKSLECHQQAFDIHQSLGNKQGIASSYSAMGNVYLAQGYRSGNEEARDEANKKALEYFTKAYELGKEIGELKLMAMALNNTALVYHEMGLIQESKETHEKVLSMSIEMKNPMYQANALNNLGVSHEALSDSVKTTEERDSLWQVALRYYTDAFEQRKALGQVDLITNSMTNIAALKRRMAISGPPSQKDQLLREALLIAEECFALTNESGNLSERSHAAQALSEIYKAQGRFKEAFESYEIYISTRDSINSEDQRAELLRQEMTYDFEKKELEKSREYEQELLQQRNQRNMLFAGAVLSLIVIVFLINGLRVRRKAAKVLSDKNIQVEAARAQAERSEQSKQIFLANMSHEIRTPMNAISGLSRILLDKQHDKQTTEYLTAISRSSENLTVVLNDILDQAKIEAGKIDVRPVAIDVHAELRNVMKIWSVRAIEKKLSMNLIIDEKFPQYVLLDPARLNQILGNLIGNAIKFTDEGSIQLYAVRKEDHMYFEIHDTGMGISHEEQEMIFESFGQSEQIQARSKGGTGLGLSIAKQLAGLMNGKMELKSDLGKGSIFTLILPIKEAAQDDLVNRVIYSKHDKVLHVLVAEDNDYNFIVTRDTLLKYFPNANIIRAHNGIEAVRALQEDDYDVVFMDVHMPLLNGYEATKAIRKENATIPILGLTASVLNSDINKCMDVGMNGYIPKPFSESEFIETISNLLKLDFEVKSSVEDSEHERMLFLKIIPMKIESLRKAVQENDGLAISELAHTLRPQLVNNNLHQMAKWCDELQNQNDGHDLTIAEKLLAGLSVALSNYQEIK